MAAHILTIVVVLLFSPPAHPNSTPFQGKVPGGSTSLLDSAQDLTLGAFVSLNRFARTLMGRYIVFLIHIHMCAFRCRDIRRRA